MALQLGDQGEEVRDLQRAINRYLDARGLKRRIRVDGEYGADTAKAAHLVRWLLGIGRRKRDRWRDPLSARVVEAIHDPSTRSGRDFKRSKRRKDRFMRQVRRRRRRRQRAKGRASKYVSWAELACHNGCPVPDEAKGGYRFLCVKVIDPLRVAYGTVVVNSGYRTETLAWANSRRVTVCRPGYNASIGGASLSFHQARMHPDGPAADVRFATGHPEAWAASARRTPVSGLGTYRAAVFIHVDGRSREGYGYSEWSG